MASLHNWAKTGIRNILRGIAVASVMVCAARAFGEAAGKEWVKNVLVQIGPGPDALGGRVPGGWGSRGGAKIEVTRERAFTGEHSLKIYVLRNSGGCSRLVTLPRGEGQIELSCWVFVPRGAQFERMPAVAIWRGRGVVVARAKPVSETGRWVRSALRIDRPAGRLFYFGIEATKKGRAPAFYYVDAFSLRFGHSRHNLLENADFEQDASDKRAQLLKDFDPDLVNVWHASQLNRDGFFSKHGVRIASWGKVEYDAAIDWDKRLEEFKAKAAKRDINGNIVVRPGQPPFTYAMCHHSPVWHEYQKAGLTSIVGENDALGQDNICNPSFRTKDACFCEWCERDFRKYLKSKFSRSQLARLIPGSIDDFSIADYVRSIRATRPGAEILEDPLAREFIRCQYLYAKRLLADIVQAIDEKAKAMGRAVPFFGNQGAPWGGIRMPVYSVIISDIVDAQCLEVFLFRPYRQRRRHAWGALQYKLMRAATLNAKPVWSLLPQEEPRRFPTGAQLHVAEALSNGAVPILIWSAMSYPPLHVYNAHRQYARLLNENRALFLEREPLAQVGLVYSVPTCFWRYFPSYRLYGAPHGTLIGGVARILEDAHIPYEVVVFGHPDLLDDREQLRALRRFKVLVLTAVECISDEQASALRAFVESGGWLVVIGNLGARNEEYVRRDETVLATLMNEPELRKRVVVLPESIIREYMSIRTNKTAVERAFATVRRAVMRGLAGRELLKTNAPATVWITLWKAPNDRRVSVHLVNYDVNLERSEFVPARNIKVTVRLPRGFHFNRVRLLAPGETPMDLPFQRGEDTVSFRIPLVRCYAIAVITTDDELDAANLIANVWRNIDRAHVAARACGTKVDDRSVRALVLMAESFYRRGQFARAQEVARRALEQSKRLLEQARTKAPSQ